MPIAKSSAYYSEFGFSCAMGEIPPMALKGHRLSDSECASAGMNRPDGMKFGPDLSFE
jgi:hypothetical protein